MALVGQEGAGTVAQLSHKKVLKNLIYRQTLE